MSNSKKTATVDSVSSIRLYLLSVPALFGFALTSVERGSMIWNISLAGIAVGILLVVLRLAAQFNSETQKITWKWGFIVPLIPYRTVAFKDVASIVKLSKSQREHLFIGGEISGGIVSKTYYRIYVVLKKKNKMISLINVDNSTKVDAHCERIAEVMTFTEKSSGGPDNRRWGR